MSTCHWDLWRIVCTVYSVFLISYFLSDRIKVLNCGRGCGFVAMLDIEGNC